VKNPQIYNTLSELKYECKKHLTYTLYTRETSTHTNVPCPTTCYCLQHLVLELKTVYHHMPRAWGLWNIIW